MKDQHTLIERSDTLIVQSYHTVFMVCSQHKGFNFITFYYFEACISNANVSSENNFGLIEKHKRILGESSGDSKRMTGNNFEHVRCRST